MVDATLSLAHEGVTASVNSPAILIQIDQIALPCCRSFLTNRPAAEQAASRIWDMLVGFAEGGACRII
jgi:hypothetical protein